MRLVLAVAAGYVLGRVVTHLLKVIANAIMRRIVRSNRTLQRWIREYDQDSEHLRQVLGWDKRP